MKIKPADSKTWYQQNGNNTYRINYDLNKNSVVVDLGARIGEWSDLIRQKYGCNVYCFEAIKEFSEQLKLKSYSVFNYAVVDRFGTVDLGIFESEASVLYDGCDTNKILTVDSIPASEIFNLINKNEIDLIKINVEGAEYGILNNLIDNNLVQKIKSIQVQFHIIKNYETQYNYIVEKLGQTHKITWRFPFVWENWQLK